MPIITEEADRLAESFTRSPSPGPGLRIDAPHQLGDAPRAAPPASGDSLPPESDDLLEQLRMQARQLAQHLLARQRETDLREARINAHQAALENEIRSERLGLLEQRAELAEQADDLVRRECELQERASRVSAAEEFLAHSRRQDEQALEQQREQLHLRGKQLEAVATRVEGQRAALHTAQRRFQAQRRRQQQSLRLARQSLQAQRQASQAMFRGLLEGIETHRARLAGHEELLAQREAAWLVEARNQQSALQEQAAQLQAQRQLLELSEAALEREWEQVREQQAALAGQIRQWEEERRTAEEQDEAERLQWQARLREEQQILAHRGEELDARRQELDQLQHNLRQLHRESLETQLAGEELLGQLSGAVPAAALTSSISRLRRKLDDQFRLAQSDLAQQRQELESLRATLAQRHEQLVAQKTELQTWVRQREATIEQQAARLVAREQELDWQQEQFRVIEERWQEERHGYQQEIRGLLARLRREALPA